MHAKRLSLLLIFSFLLFFCRQVAADNLLLFLPSILHKKTAQTQRMAVGYLPSWGINWFSTATAGTSQIATIPEVYTHSMIAFAQPDLSFNGTNWTGTGIQFSMDLSAVRAAIDLLHARGQKIFLAVGGATYNNWDALVAEQGRAISGTTHKKALYDLMLALDLDGLDVDYEADSNLVRYKKSILALHEVIEALGTDKELSLAGWSTGADCTIATSGDPWCSGQGISWWGGNAGRELQVFRALVDSGYPLEELFAFVSVMSYDGGTNRFSPVNLWGNYRKIYEGTLNLGMELAPESWGGAELVASNVQAQACSATSIIQGDSYQADGIINYSVEELSVFIKTQPQDKAGVMLWALYDSKTGSTCEHAVDFLDVTEALEAYLAD